MHVLKMCLYCIEYCVHHTRNVAQDGLDIGVAHCGNLRQILCDSFRFYRLALYYGTGIIYSLLLVIRFFVEWHSFFCF